MLYPSPSSVRTAPKPSPTAPTWPSTCASTRGPSPTTAATVRRPSASSLTCSSTHGFTPETDHTSVCIQAVTRHSPSCPISSLTEDSTTKINHSSATTVTERTRMLLPWKSICLLTLSNTQKCIPVPSVAVRTLRRPI